MMIRYFLISSALIFLLVKAATWSTYSPPEKDICQLKPVSVFPQRCRGKFPMFTFNAASGRCEKFFYGGCDGTKNLFATRAKCENACITGPRGSTRRART